MNYLGIPCSVLITAVAYSLTLAASADGTTYRVTASVTANFPAGEGPVPTATGEFSFVFNDDFLGGSTRGEMGDFPVSAFSTSLNPIGSISYDTSNTEGYVFYNQGSLRQVLVGGVGPTVLDENSVGGNSDDFYISLLLSPNGKLDDIFGSSGDFAYSTTDEIEIYQADIVTGTIVIAVIPEPTTYALAFAALLMAVGRSSYRIP